MREHLLSCLHDMLWPLPTTISFEFKECTEVRLEFVVPGLDIVPDREAAMASGNRVSIRRMQEVIHRLHNQHALGLVVRLIGELFTALPTVQLATVSTLQPAANGKPTRYIASAHADRSTWSALHIRGAVTADAATNCLQEMGARFNMTTLGALLVIGPFD
jgi:hypothetical protein